MEWQIKIEGKRPIIMHSGSSMGNRNAISAERAGILAKRNADRTQADEARLAELDCYDSLWVEGSRPTVPATALRKCIETAARKLKQGPLVREGLIITNTEFAYDERRYGSSLAEVITNAQFTTGVVVQRNRILRTRAMFEQPWSCVFTADTDDELIEKDQLVKWLDIGGRRIGLGDWRPEKSGDYGRYEMTSIVELGE